MGSQAEYEKQKAARKAARDQMIAKAQTDEAAQAGLISAGFEMLDRFVTSWERIADAMEKKNG
jgi:hypothetical protein